MLKTLYVDTRQAGLLPEGEALRVTRPGKADSLVPLRRVDRAIIRHEGADLLQACLAIINNGGSVHFEDASGNICAQLKQPWADGTRWARDMAGAIERTSGRSPYRSWLDVQHRHAWSLVFRRNYQGNFHDNRRKLLKYLLYFRPEIKASSELEWLEQQLWAWLQARLQHDGLQPIVQALQAKGLDLIHDLAPCLLINLLWSYVCWRRHQAMAMVGERTNFFELQAHTRLYNQLQRHIHALEFSYHRQNCVEETDGSERGAGRASA